MIKSALEFLIQLSGPNQYKYGEVDYTDKQIYPVEEPMANSIIMHSLQGLVDYLNDTEEYLPGVFIQILYPHQVNLWGQLTQNTRQREKLVEVAALTQEFPFGNFMSSESFIIGLQSNFEQTEILENLLKIVGNVQESQVKQTTDDGVAQSVTAKVSIVKVADISLPNPIALKPFRTFPEVAQPVSRFVLRAQDGSGGNKGPNWALFEADGCKWQLDALESIKAWLEAKVDKKIKVLG